MSGPEQLDSGSSRPPGWAVRVLVAALVVVLAVGVVWDQRRSSPAPPTPGPSPTVSRSAPAPVPAPTKPTPERPSSPVTFWPGARGEARPLAQGLPAGTVYARSADILYTIDVRTGRVVVTSIQTTTANDTVSMVPTRDGVAIRPWDDTAGLLVRDGRQPVDLPGQLGTADDLLPGPSGRLWALTRADDDPFDTTATLVDTRGRRDGPRLTTTGNYTSDGATGLLLTDVGGAWQEHPQPIKRVTGGSVTSVGAHHYQVLECDDRHRCTEALLDRRNGRRTPLRPRQRSYSNSLISPSGAFVASVDGFGNTDPQTTISRMADHEVVEKLPAPPEPTSSQPGSVSWLSERWLAVITGGGLTLYDTLDDRLITPDLPVEDLLQLTWQPS